MTLSDKKSKRKKIIKQKNISEVISKPWAKKMFSLYIFGEEGKKVIRFTDFKKILNTNQKVVRDHINELCDVGFLYRVKKGEGYVYSRLFALCYIFKYEDMRLINDCPVESIYSMVMPYRKIEEDLMDVRCLSIYGLKKSNEELEKNIEPLLWKLRHYFDSMHAEGLQTIIDEECKKLRDEHMVDLIRNWHAKLGENKLLHPLRIRDEIEPVRIKFDVLKEHEEEFKKITERLWSRFYKEYPPIGIMMRF